MTEKEPHLRTYEDLIKYLASQLSEDAKEELKSLSDFSFWSEHFGIGMYIRNLVFHRDPGEELRKELEARNLNCAESDWEPILLALRNWLNGEEDWERRPTKILLGGEFGELHVSLKLNEAMEIREVLACKYESPERIDEEMVECFELSYDHFGTLRKIHQVRRLFEYEVWLDHRGEIEHSSFSIRNEEGEEVEVEEEVFRQQWPDLLLDHPDQYPFEIPPLTDPAYERVELDFW